MKLALIALAIFAAPSAFAHTRGGEDCTPYFVSQNTESGLGYWVSPCGPVTQHRGCNEGEIGYFNTILPNGDNNPNGEMRVCHNGTFFPEGRHPVKHRGCVEGQISHSNELDPSGNFYQDVTIVCHNGRFVRR